MEKPKNVKAVNFEYIVDYVKQQGNADVQWLKETATKKMPPDKNGKERKITFIELRNEFVRKYMPELMPPAKPKKPSMYEIIDNL